MEKYEKILAVIEALENTHEQFDDGPVREYIEELQRKVPIDKINAFYEARRLKRRQKRKEEKGR